VDQLGACSRREGFETLAQCPLHLLESHRGRLERTAGVRLAPCDRVPEAAKSGLFLRCVHAASLARRLVRLPIADDALVSDEPI
jgi:hypothetical protein